jgi:outer membrane protein
LKDDEMEGWGDVALRTMARGVFFVMGPAMLTACVATGDKNAPASAQRQWQSSGAPAEWRALAVSGVGVGGYANTSAAQPPLQQDREYDLPELIDLAQRNSPDTRLAWSQARQAASAVGIVDATFLPMLSAHVVGGYVSTRNQLPEILGQRFHVDTRSSGVVPLATLQWLLFDFGQRSALRDSAHSLSLGANFLYNGAHQKLIYSVMNTYYEYDAARQRYEIAQASLGNSEAVLAAVEARRRNGLATTIELAQVRQLVAQARLRVVTTRGLERNAYQALAAAIGVDPTAALRVAPMARRPLPPATDVSTQEVLRQALADRPDVMASVAALKAAEHSVEAAKADFLPKVYLAGFAAAGSRNLDVGNLPVLAGQSNANGVIVGISLPIFDGGLRDARLQDANDRVQASQAALAKVRMEAMRQIVVASTTLETALQANEAAVSLEAAALVTYDAALDAYRQGVGTVTAATEAANGLLAARGARADAYSAAMTGAATLAFSLGRINAERGQ